MDSTYSKKTVKWLLDHGMYDGNNVSLVGMLGSFLAGFSVTHVHFTLKYQYIHSVKSKIPFSWLGLASKFLSGIIK